MKRYQLIIMVLIMVLIGVAGWNKVSNEIETNYAHCYTDIECQDYYDYILDEQEGEQE